MSMIPARRHLLLGLGATLLTACATGGKRPPMAYVNGNAFYLERIAFPRDKTLLRVRLLDVTNPDAPPAVLAEQSLEKVGTPAAFSLCYDAANNKVGRKYAVDARLFIDGELRMQGAESLTSLDSAPEIRLVMVGN